MKQWNRFNFSMQENICQRYDVILTDYKITREKIATFLNKINIKNFNKGVEIFNKSMNQFSKTVDSLTADIALFILR